MAQSDESGDSTNSLSLAIITAGILGTILFLLSIASIAAMLSMNSDVNEATQTSDGATGRQIKIINPDKDPSEIGGMDKDRDAPGSKVIHFFDSLYQEDDTTSVKAPS